MPFLFMSGLCIESDRDDIALPGDIDNPDFYNPLTLNPNGNRPLPPSPQGKNAQHKERCVTGKGLSDQIDRNIEVVRNLIIFS